ncbi:MAG TPA: phytanoyl-CoA dioxygenase family protein [Xenococcaceae cyanobacterium]
MNLFTNQYPEQKPPTEAQLAEWIEFFHQNGFLVIPQVLTPERCQQLRDDLDRDITEKPSEYADSNIAFSHRMFERSPANLSLFDLEPIVTFAEALIGGANGQGIPSEWGLPNANTVHVIHNNSFVVAPHNPGLGSSKWHQDDTPHILSLDGQPLTKVRLNVLVFTVNYYLTDVLAVANGPTQVIPGSHLFGKFCLPEIEGYEAQIQSCLAPMGSAICFNNQVWHRGAPNLSDTPRYITQVTYAKRLVGHKYAPFMNYQMPEACYQNANPRLKRLLGFLLPGAYG